jgi:serine/arginine repetitive matrix protein 2
VRSTNGRALPWLRNCAGSRRRSTSRTSPASASRSRSRSARSRLNRRASSSKHRANPGRRKSARSSRARPSPVNRMRRRRQGPARLSRPLRRNVTSVRYRNRRRRFRLHCRPTWRAGPGRLRRRRPCRIRSSRIRFSTSRCGGAATVAAPAAASLWRRAPRLFRHRHQGCPRRCQRSRRGLGTGGKIRTRHARRRSGT